jgi:hypothetical protein
MSSKNKAPTRHYDKGYSILFFAKEAIIVYCPKCAAIGYETLKNDNDTDSCKHQFSCTQCPQKLNQQTSSIIIKPMPSLISNRSAATSPYFGLSLYLKTATRFGTLWAYNYPHLFALKQFISANLRERLCDAGNAAWTSRLPTWMKQARHRKELLKAIARLENLSPQDG